MPHPSLPIPIRIILVEPAGALNVGSVARVMKNMGLSHLVLVNPHCDHLGSEARQMAVHAFEVLEAAQIVPTLPQGLGGCQRAIAATGRPHTPAFTLEHPRQALPWLLENSLLENSLSSSAALIFGPEDRGLNNEELHHAHRFIYIPANPDYPSLNLAQAVAICCYELYQLSHTFFKQTTHASQDIPPNPHPPTPLLSPAPLDQLEGFYQQLETLLLEIGYLFPHTAPSRMQKFRRLFHRALPTQDEVTMLRGILSQVKWAIEQRAEHRKE
ncbi:MAG: RNA methyltransferase [Leptolyngbyaceae cyanobacterium bins.302]|nr:RNA methyltransferase [Leptolyngbyaceae cyanobacterium bins.302]